MSCILVLLFFVLKPYLTMHLNYLDSRSASHSLTYMV